MKLTFDDVLLMPRYSELESRSEANIATDVGGLKLDLPIISAPMDTVTEESMALFMYEKGGLGAIHRYMSITEQFTKVKWVKEMGARVAAAVGVNGDADERVDALLEAGADMIVIDVGHGWSKKCLVACEQFVAKGANVMSGNIVSLEAGADYVVAGAKSLRIGVGPGSACKTRTVAGVGYPQLQAILDVADKFWEISIVADGGIRTSGDIVKALAAGADAVMVGGMLSPFHISAGPTGYETVDEPSFTNPEEKRTVRVKEFRGMASRNALSEYKKTDDFVTEGESYTVPVRYDYEEFVNGLRDSIQIGFAYLGARNLNELQINAEFVEISQNGYVEGLAKGVK